MLDRSRYWVGRETDLSPVDLALGWGPMSRRSVLERLKISQAGRWYYYSWPSNPPIAPDEIKTHSTNMHMVPANDAVRRTILAVERGDVVELRGYLVSITAADGWHWRSSLTRSDSGDGACELVWVEQVTVRPAN